MEQAQKSSQQLPSIVDKDFPVQWTRSPTSVSLQSAAPSFTLPQLFVTTKAERYADLTAFDRKALQRPKAHFRNALKTTEDLERISKQLDAVSIWQHLICWYKYYIVKAKDNVLLQCLFPAASESTGEGKKKQSVF